MIASNFLTAVLPNEGFLEVIIIYSLLLNKVVTFTAVAKGRNEKGI